MILRVSIMLLAAVLCGAASARTYTLGDLSIHRPWARALPPIATNGAAWFRVENGGSEAAHIVSVHSPIAGRAEIHTHETDGGLLRMRRLHSVEVPAQGAVSFAPGGLHVMLLGLNEALVSGERFPLTVEFREAGAIEVSVEIVDDDGTGHSGHSGSGPGATH